MLISFVRTLILYFLIVSIMRLMGKRQIGELQPSELVVALVIADLAAVPMADVGIPLLYGIIPILTLFICEELLSYISLKSQRARGIICGTPSILIEKGVIVQKELNRLRYNLNDLLEQLRLKDYHNLEDVEYAILETCGKLSVIPKLDKTPITAGDMNIQLNYTGLPATLIIDGRINSENLKLMGLDEAWLNEQLKLNNIKSAKYVFFAYVNEDKTFRFQVKDKKISV